MQRKKRGQGQPENRIEGAAKLSESHRNLDSQSRNALAQLADKLPGEGQTNSDAHPRSVQSRQSDETGGQHMRENREGSVADELSEGYLIVDAHMKNALAQLAELQIRRKFFINAVNRQTNAAGALVRRALGWQADEDETKREKVKAKAAKIVADALNGKGCELASVASDLEVIAQSIAPLHAVRHQCELQMKRVMRKLPIWEEWAENVRGLGELGCAVILAETGDLGKYANPAKVWKRLGLAPHEGKAMSTWRRDGGLSAEDWTAAGYSPRRRAEIFSCVGDPLFRQQTMIAGPYRLAYDARRIRTAETHPDWTKLHSHNDALRIMTKKLIADLWSAWRQARSVVIPMAELPAATSNPDDYAEHRANMGMKPRTTLPDARHLSDGQ